MQDSLLFTKLANVVADTVPDADLLRRFAEDRDGAAFELLVRRYAGVVWAACRGVLPTDRHAAEDAFQSTFLVLARKAGALRAETVAGFLYRVACNAARRAKKRKPTSGEMPAEQPAPPVADLLLESEQAVAVAEEVARLAEKFRLPVLLCFYDGCTHTEAAARLGWSIGTVASRLARAKDRLRERLARRGLALPIAVVGTTPIAAVRAAIETTLAPSALSPAVAELTQEVLIAMTSQTKKLLWAAGLMLTVAATPVLVGTLAGQPKDEKKKDDKPAAKQPPPEGYSLPPTEFPEIQVKKLRGLAKGEEEYPQEEIDKYMKQFDPPELPKPQPNDGPIVKLAKAKLKAITEARRIYLKRVFGGINTSHEFINYLDLSRDMIATVNLLNLPRADQEKWYRHQVLLMKLHEEYFHARLNSDSGAGRGQIDFEYSFPLSSAARLDAEIALLKLKQMGGGE